ncbi:tyrosine-type recombinase/integrase [Segetibacter aerophilus]|uniref:Tyr recombinase domain-containing protein n=1 Tax=Segetibacter aerophilus TaxID=670293 RepID=A0A512BA23_9BACT|nr:site-specific integrase [Segetibacter aerophilus]GEO08788.1 hypothetical protein SAE01_12840 [Segetibacter aerophilus]
MLRLENNCRVGNFTVFPSNWKTVRANVNLIWKIKFRFYDDNTGQVKQIVVKGMNSYATLKEKRDATQALLENERSLIVDQLYNPITEQFFNREPEAQISTTTEFTKALDFALERVKAGKETMDNLRSIVAYIKKAAEALKYSQLPISAIRIKHLTLLLEKCGELKKKSIIVVSKRKGKTKKGVWTSNTFNQYRAHLGMLFKILKKMEVCEANYPLEMDKETTVKKIRETLTPAQRQEVNDVIMKKDRNFWRFLHIFFHSGSRITEILSVKAANVDIEKQRFKVLVKKGKQYKEEYRTIKTLVLPLWEELINESKPDEYIFHRRLKPGGKKPIRRDQITRRWLQHVKQPLGITADFYSLKHSNTTETVELLSESDAASHNGHTTTAMVRKIYDVNNKQRQLERLKGIDNKFA